MKIKGLCKSYGGKTVISSFSYTFEKGRTYCLFGESGCGKTTLLNMIMGIEKPDSGEIDGNERVRAVFQESRLLAWRTVLENVCLGGGDRNEAAKLLCSLGLGGEENSYPDSLSGGMCRRVAIARALYARPDILLLDEPYGELDEDTADTAAALIKSRMAGKITILVTHNMARAEKYADEILVLSAREMKITDVVTPVK